MDYQKITINQELVPGLVSKSQWKRKLCIILLFIASAVLFLRLLTESIRVYRIIQTNKMINEEASVSLGPGEGAYQAKHRPMGVNKDYNYVQGRASPRYKNR